MTKRKNYHYGDLRSRLVEVTSKILENEGIDSLTMRSLSKKLGVSRTAAYRHFPDKASLLKAVAEDTFNMMRVYIHEKSANEKNPLDRFKAISNAYLEFATRNSARYRQMFSREVVSEPGVPELREAAWKAFSEFMDVIETCQREGVFKQNDPVELANVAWATVHGLSLLLIDGQIRTSEDGISLHALLINGYSKPSQSVTQLADATISMLMEGFRKK